MRQSLFVGVVAALLVAFQLITPATAVAYGTCPGNTTAQALEASNPSLTVFPLASYGGTGIFVGGDTSTIFPYGIICDLTHDVGAVNGQSGNFGSFSPISDTGGIAYFGQTAGDIFSLIFSSNNFPGGSNTGLLFFIVDSAGLVLPLSNPPVVSAVHIVSNNASTTLAKPGDTVTLTFSSDSDVQTPNVHIGTHAASVATTTGNNFTASTTLDSSDTEGTVTFSIKLTNNFGNTGFTVSTTTDNSSFMFDKTAPVITITGGPAEGATATSSPVAFTFTNDDPVATTQCSFDAGATSTCSGSASAALADGPHTLYLASTDAAGNSTSINRSFVVDTTPPTLSIDSGPADGSTISTSSVEFAFTTDAASAQCSYDGSATSTCSSPFATTSPDGSHTFALSATDPAGNQSYLSRTFTINTAPPPPPPPSGGGGGNGPPRENPSQGLPQGIVQGVETQAVEHASPKAIETIKRVEPPAAPKSSPKPATPAPVKHETPPPQVSERSSGSGIVPVAHASGNGQDQGAAVATVHGDFLSLLWILFVLPLVGGAYWGVRKLFRYTIGS